MPNHWESSARPLFVKTVFVNGNRHAILSQEDPLLHSNHPSWLKKQSRPNSSLSLASTLSTSSTETQDSDSNMRIKSSKRQSIRQRRGKDISSELQGCLIKLRIASSLKKNKNESAEEGMFYNPLEEMKWTQNEPNEDLNEKRKKCNHDKNTKKKHCERNHIKSAKENNFAEITNEPDNCCYVYNLENNRGKKNYCFVKISSKPSHLILKCSCEKTWSSNPSFCTSKEFSNQDKNKMALSATFHNLIMTTDSDEKSKKYSSDYLFTLFNSDPCDLYWNSYLARSFYNSLSERVIQWIDLKSKRKKTIEKTDSKPEDDSPDKIERICVGKTFLDHSNKYEITQQTGSKIQGNLENKVKKEKENMRRVEKSEEDVEAEVKVEGNIETALSIQKFENQTLEEKRENSRPEIIIKDLEKNQIYETKQEETNNPMTLIPQKLDSNSYTSNYLQESIANRLNTAASSLTKPCISVQEIMLNDDSQGKFLGFSTSHNKKKTLREKRNSLKRQKKVSEFVEDYEDDEDEDDDDDDDSEEDKQFRVTAIKCWEKGLLTSKNKRNTSANNFQIYNETTACICNKSGEDNAKSCKYLNLTQQPSEKTQRSINNQNITRSTFCQNLLSPQQQQQPRKIPWLEDDKNSWVTEKNLGRPQLHIFMPPIPSSDPSEESMSECESFLSEVF